MTSGWGTKSERQQPSAAQPQSPQCARAFFLPKATAPATPANSYGFLRFRVR